VPTICLKKARASGRNVGKVFNPVLKLVFENYPFAYYLHKSTIYTFAAGVDAHRQTTPAIEVGRV